LKSLEFSIFYNDRFDIFIETIEIEV
jgi:hypothetical protein